MSEPIINKIAESGIITIDPANYLPTAPIAIFDLKGYLFMEMILKEKDFREALKKEDWQQYAGKYVGVVCSADAIIPVWAYMLVVSYLQPVALDVIMGDEAQVQRTVFQKNIEAINTDEFADKRLVIKGCGDVAIGEYVYLDLTKRLLPVAKSIMYGEPCSTVPVYKKR